MHVEKSIAKILNHVQVQKQLEKDYWKGSCAEAVGDVEYKHMLDACLYFVPATAATHPTRIEIEVIKALAKEVSDWPVSQ